MDKIRNKLTNEIMCDGLSLKEVIERHRKWLMGEDGGERAILAGANLEGVNLSGANLRSANLSFTNLDNAHLVDVGLVNAFLRGASLVGANLYGANLASANLRDANMSGAKLDDANLIGADMMDVKGLGNYYWFGTVGKSNRIGYAYEKDGTVHVCLGCLDKPAKDVLLAIQEKYGKSDYIDCVKFAIKMVESRMKKIEKEGE